MLDGHYMRGTYEEKKMTIELRTRKNNPIRNDQYCGNLPYKDFHDNQVFERKYCGTKFKSSPTGIYNCHGLTFACRRTRIYDNQDIRRILKEDDYHQIQFDDIFFGDLILYVTNLGDISHSGIIVNIDNSGGIKVPMVLSKWGNGSEVYHAFKNCPYWNTDIHLEYYRIF